jgi:hypothetical protein
MALTDFQRRLCHLLADRRRTGGESYVAGGVAMGVVLDSRRLSRDLDLFHDTTEAVARSWDADRALLLASGYDVSVLRERPGFVQAEAASAGERLLIEWTRDSAFRFCPLVEHPDLGLTLHPFDLAIHKVLALIGRAEVRDWVDVLHCHAHVQPLGFLAWAACGKDPRFTPSGVLEQARRSSHYSAPEVAALDFGGEPPDAVALSHQWQLALDQASEIVQALPASEVGKAVLANDATLFRGGVVELRGALGTQILFHEGRIGGALPVTRLP